MLITPQYQNCEMLIVMSSLSLYFVTSIQLLEYMTPPPPPAPSPKKTHIMVLARVMVLAHFMVLAYVVVSVCVTKILSDPGVPGPIFVSGCLSVRNKQTHLL